MQIEHDTIRPPENGIIRHDADVVDRPRVAGERHPVLVGRVGRLVPAHHRQRLALWHMETLDLDRALG